MVHAYVMINYDMLWSVMICYEMLCYNMLWYAMKCYVTICYDMLWNVMLRYVTICYEMLCYDMLWYVRICCVCNVAVFSSCTCWAKAHCFYVYAVGKQPVSNCWCKMEGRGLATVKCGDQAATRFDIVM